MRGCLVFGELIKWRRREGKFCVNGVTPEMILISLRGRLALIAIEPTVPGWFAAINSGPCAGSEFEFRTLRSFAKYGNTHRKASRIPVAATRESNSSASRENRVVAARNKKPRLLHCQLLADNPNVRRISLIRNWLSFSSGFNPMILFPAEAAKLKEPPANFSDMLGG